MKPWIEEGLLVWKREFEFRRMLTSMLGLVKGRKDKKILSEKVKKKSQIVLQNWKIDLKCKKKKKKKNTKIVSDKSKKFCA